MRAADAVGTCEFEAAREPVPTDRSAANLTAAVEVAHPELARALDAAGARVVRVDCEDGRRAMDDLAGLGATVRGEPGDVGRDAFVRRGTDAFHVFPGQVQA